MFLGVCYLLAFKLPRSTYVYVSLNITCVFMCFKMFPTCVIYLLAFFIGFVLVFYAYCVLLMLHVCELLTFYSFCTVSHVLAFFDARTYVYHARTYVFATQVEKKRK